MGSGGLDDGRPERLRLGGDNLGGGGVGLDVDVRIVDCLLVIGGLGDVGGGLEGSLGIDSGLLDGN